MYKMSDQIKLTIWLFMVFVRSFLLSYNLHCYTVLTSAAANVMSSSQDEAYSSGHFKDVKGLIMGMLETYSYEEVSNMMVSSHTTLYWTALTRHYTKQPIIFYSTTFVTRWSSCTPCHSGGCPQTQQTVPYVINRLTQFIILLVKKATLLFSGEQALLLPGA